jgi:hypothetical protein
MNSTVKGIISVVISAFFFFPWIWLRILNFYLHIDISSYSVFIIGIIIATVAIILGVQARKGGSRVLGTAGLTLGIISIVLNVTNLFAVILSRS